ncbi:hypothetical protein [Evansella tamaricis]|uniref:Uncharacterized protein n=1 Tax=Evansella tamaricis TaxID=2069301 RepID=A0ABS6JBJ0_9BACI|nr:hypothetical protein [Evansella tamaricis]MBU9711042.1 hypothetical protein [Evansella tamaricis]
MKSNFMYYVCVSWGFSIGIVSSLFIFMYLFPGLLIRPIDTLLTAILGILGTVIGSFIGGFIAYKIAVSQTNSHFDMEIQNKNNTQRNIYNRTYNEIKNNYENIKKLNELLKRVEGGFHSISAEISKGNNEIIEGIMVHINQIDADLPLKLSENLEFEKHYHLHKSINLLTRTKSIGQLLINQRVNEYIEYNLKKLLETSDLFLSIFDKTPN